MSDARPARASLLLRRPILVGFAVMVLMAVLREWDSIRDSLLLCFFSVLLAAALCFPIDLLARRMSRAAATLVTLAAFLSFAAVTVLVAAPLVADQVRELGQSLLDASAQIDAMLRHLGRRNEGAAVTGPEAAQALREGLHGALNSVLPRAIPATLQAMQLLYAIAVMLALAFFLAAAPDLYRAWLRSLVPREREALYDATWERVGGALRAWMRGIIVSMTLMGTLAAIGLRLIGVEGWLPLAALVFVGTFVPYVGAVIGTIPGLAVALAHSPVQFAWALLVYALVHLVEGMLVEPLIMHRAVKLRPAVLLAWQFLMGAAFGLPGVIVATPLLACVQESADLLWVERSLGKKPASA